MAPARAQPSARDPTPVGCVLLMAGAVVLVVLPSVLPPVEVPRWLGLVIAGPFLVVGVVLWLLGSTFGSRPVRRRIDEAVATLQKEWPDGSRTRATQAAVTLLVDAYISPGPYTVTTYEPTEMALRLGPALPFVRSVERVLLEAEAIDPVFT